MAYPFNNTLNDNLIYTSELSGALPNMIIGQRFFIQTVATATLANMFRKEGSKFGDTYLNYFGTFEGPYLYGNAKRKISPMRLNVNQLDNNENHSIDDQSIVIGTAVQCAVTTERTFAKQAWMNDSNFSDALGFLVGTLEKIITTYEMTLTNGAVGTHVSKATDANVTVPALTDEEKTQGITFGQKIAEIVNIEMATLVNDTTTTYNEAGIYSSYSKDNMVVVANVNAISKVKYLDLPGLFHKEGLEIGSGLQVVNLPAKWFGTPNKTATTASATVRCNHTGHYNVSADTAVYVPDFVKLSDADKKKCIHMYRGETMPTGKYKSKTRGYEVTVTSTKFPAGDAYVEAYSYTEDPKVLFKLMERESIQYRSSNKMGSEFYFPINGAITNYLTIVHSDPEFLVNKLFMTFKTA